MYHGGVPSVCMCHSAPLHVRERHVTYWSWRAPLRHSVYVAIVTLATTLVLLTFFSGTASPSYHIGSALIGGYNGMTGIPPLGFRDHVAVDARRLCASIMLNKMLRGIASVCGKASARDLIQIID